MATTHAPREQPRAFVEPADRDVPVWRYMNFAKFVSLLHRQALFFSRADLLGDAFEGSLSTPTQMARQAWLATASPLDAKAVALMGQFTKWVREWTFVSCWHMNEHESAAMWKLYSHSNEAVAIQSTYATLVDCLPDKRSTYAGVVKYADYESEFIPSDDSFSPVMHKRRSFEHERELRIVWQDLPIREHAPPRPRPREDIASGFIPVGEANREAGRYVPVDMQKLIRRVLVAPTSPPWFHEVVQSVARRFDLATDVSQSSLDASPLF